MPELINPYLTCDRWIRGNIHTHTTASDGKSDPQDVVDWYAAHGYDFLIITDHNLVLALDGLDSRGMLLVRGEELTASCSHVLGLGIQETLPRGESTQEQIDLVNEAGGLAVVCHPYWMGLSPQDIEPLHGYFGIELFNRVCFRLNGKGDSVAWWDTLLSKGKRSWGLAVDDCHDLEIDAGHGWLMVAARENTWPALREALSQGSFAASSGPRFDRISVLDREVTISAAGWTQARFIGQDGRVLHDCGAGSAVPAPDFSFVLPETEPFVRVEISDEQGLRAWSQPFWMSA
ncbi:MAG: CehA/McbA family metallohydrolase [Chloroflexi bacterium]|nr:CehA/McbA family metallohydrolase [Chloroflexota bacterium]